jgi:asparagine synthase (glutamine-hydrolysing)
MCGIAGFVDPSSRVSGQELESTALEMMAALRHRGPDDQGIWTDTRSGVTLGHRRLAIQDLSQEGHQPMQSADGRYVLIFNGEIYNFIELRGQLEQKGCSFRGHSDTEVMLAALSHMGLEPAINKFTGMFAFALWDRQLRRLHLVRDRAGEKPLYYGWSGGVFLFGSELKALQVHPGWRGELDREALVEFMRHNYIPAPRSIYRDIFKLQPGSILTLGPIDWDTRTTPAPRKYWSLWSVAEASLARPFQGGADAAIEQLGSLLDRAIAGQMVADVPIGAFLSGGIDSSTIVARMQRQSRRPIKTFSIGFAEPGYDEAPFAKAVARHLGTQHTELYVQAEELVQTIPRLPTVYDEPSASTSHLPTLLLCELARKNVTVCLTGDGGDELFGGYGLYRRTQQVWNVLRRVPPSVRPRIAKLFKRMGVIGVRLQSGLGGDPRVFKRMSRLARLMEVPDDRSLYLLHVSVCRDAEQWLVQANAEPRTKEETIPWEVFPELIQRMMFWDFVTYLPGEVLAKVDRASMSVSLETRIPLLDHRLIEFAWSLPVSFKQRGGKGKWLLRQLLHRHVPRVLVERPKQGFAMPVEEWIRGELRPWAEELLAENRLRRDGLFQARVVREKWSEHLCRKGDWGGPLWNVLMLQSWLDAQKRHPRKGDLGAVSSAPKRSSREEELWVSAR